MALVKLQNENPIPTLNCGSEIPPCFTITEKNQICCPRCYLRTGMDLRNIERLWLSCSSCVDRHELRRSP
ncbi:unnamed protein product, partial [Amoebophrya sp. A120]|eukprot:GSA120T00012355001.1